MSSTCCSSGGTPPATSGSDIPSPRRSIRIRRENLTRCWSWAATTGSTVLARMLLRMPGTRTRSIGPLPPMQYRDRNAIRIRVPDLCEVTVHEPCPPGAKRYSPESTLAQARFPVSAGHQRWALRGPRFRRSRQLRRLLCARQLLVLGEESVELGQGVLDDPVVGHGDSGRVRRVVAIGAELGSGVVECCFTVGAH